MKINYDVTIPETETAFMLFWRKYALRRNVLLSIVYGIAIGIFIDLIAKGSTMIGGIGMGLAVGMLFSMWLKPFRAKKKLVEALETMNEEKYTAIFSESEIEIETVVNSENEEAVDKSTYPIATEELYSNETETLFLLYVNRSLVYVFPKRCLSEQEINDLRTYFIEKKI